MCIIVHPNVHHAAFLFLSLQIVLYVLSNLISITTLSLPYECRYVSLSIPCLIAHLYLYNTSHLISLPSLLYQLRGVSLSISRLITMHTLFVNPINTISRLCISCCTLFITDRNRMYIIRHPHLHHVSCRWIMSCT